MGIRFKSVLHVLRCTWCHHTGVVWLRNIHTVYKSRPHKTQEPKVLVKQGEGRHFVRSGHMAYKDELHVSLTSSLLLGFLQHWEECARKIFFLHVRSGCLCRWQWWKVGLLKLYWAWNNPECIAYSTCAHVSITLQVIPDRSVTPATASLPVYRL